MSRATPALLLSLLLIGAWACSFDTSGVSLGWPQLSPDASGPSKLDAGNRDGKVKDSFKPQPKKDKGGIKPKLDKGIGPKLDKEPNPKPDQWKPPQPDQGKPPQPDQGKPPQPDQGAPGPDQQVTSYYGRWCEKKYIGQTCPDGKTKCIATPSGNDGVCTYKCTSSSGGGCPPGPVGTNARCGTWGPNTACYFRCRKYSSSSSWPCPKELTCKSAPYGEKQCWP